jgi:putative PIG3 family NAD(P)H quinone oxidoreductase
MRAVVVGEGGSVDSLTVAEVEEPDMAPGDVLVEVVGAGVNRADLLQREGHYPPPAGASELLGLECSGIVREIAPAVTRWQPGDQVCALLSGGGYAQFVAVPEAHVMPVPKGVDIVSAAALPEAACTVMSNLTMTGRTSACDWVLIHGGASGIGSFAIQWAKAVGAHVVVTVGSERKKQICRDLGADVVINYNEQDFVEEMLAASDGHGADVILDIMGAEYLERNVKALATGGRLVVIGLQGGIRGELNLNRLLRKQGTLAATSLRSLSSDQKRLVCANVVEWMWPLFSEDRLIPLIDQRFELADAGRAHQRLEAGGVIGKLVLNV